MLRNFTLRPHILQHRLHRNWLKAVRHLLCVVSLNGERMTDIRIGRVREKHINVIKIRDLNDLIVLWLKFLMITIWTSR